MAGVRSFTPNISLPFCHGIIPLTVDLENLESASSLRCYILYSNVRSLCQASGELCRVCVLYHPLFVSLTEAHNDPEDSLCLLDMLLPLNEIELNMAGVLNLASSVCLFDEINCDDFAVDCLAELVAILYKSILIVCCYNQPSQTDLTLLTSLGELLDCHHSLSPFIYEDINVREMEWLKSTHTSPAGTATLDFCDSRGLFQLVHHPTCGSTILDLILCEHDCDISSLPNFNT